MEHLDRYEREGIDEDFIDDVTEEERFAARLAAERELAERDAVEGRLTGRRRGLPAALEGARRCLAKCAAAAATVRGLPRVGSCGGSMLLDCAGQQERMPPCCMLSCPPGAALFSNPR